MNRRLLAMLRGASIPLVIVGCSASEGDFRREAEKYLESESLAEEAGYRFSGATCDEPSSTNEGAEFACTAVDNEGDSWEFVVQITGDREITVTEGRVVG